MKKTILALSLIGACSTALAASFNCQQMFPHWSCTAGTPTYSMLNHLNTVLNNPANKGAVALFDWDGTLYNEKIATLPSSPYDAGVQFSGEASWHLWGAQHGYFPMIDTADGQKSLNAARKIDYFQGKTNIHLSGFNAFSQEATYTAGTTPSELYQGVTAWTKDYPVSKNAYLPMFDVMQQFKDHGFNVYIITGSSPYFAVSLLDNVDKTLGYKLMPTGCNPTDPNLDACHVVGNAAKLLKNGTFSMVYNDMFVKRPGTPASSDYLEHYYIDGPGKAVAIRNYVMPHAPVKKVVFYAGNSGGDYESVVYALDHNPKAMSIAVNPRGTLLDLVHEFGSSNPSQRIYPASVSTTTAKVIS